LQSSGDISKIARAMPHYQMMKTKYSVHAGLSKLCFDLYAKLGLEKITACEQILATGQTQEGNAIRVPDELTILVRSPETSITDKVRLLMLLYAVDPMAINSRQQYENNTGIQPSDQAILSEWCRIVQLSGRMQQKRPPLHDQEWQFFSSRFLPNVYDIVKNICANSLSAKEFTFQDSSEANVPFGESGGGARSKRTSIRTGFSSANAAVKFPPLYIFIAGGISYTEIRSIHTLAQEMGRDFIIGSTHIFGPRDLIEQIGGLNGNPDNLPCFRSSYIGDPEGESPY